MLFWIVTFSCTAQFGCTLEPNLINNVFVDEGTCRGFVEQVTESHAYPNLKLGCASTPVISISRSGGVFGNPQLILPMRQPKGDKP